MATIGRDDSETQDEVGDSSRGAEALRDEDMSLLVLASDLVVDADSFGLTPSQDSTPEVQDSDTEDLTGSYSSDDFSDLDQLEVLRLEGVDIKGRQILRIVGKFLPAPVIDGGRLKAYVLRKLCQELQAGAFVIVYFHTNVQRSDNSPGMLALRNIHESLPKKMKHRLEAIYVLHPGLRSRLVMATLGRFFLSEGFYSKVVYVNRLEFLTDYVKKEQVEIPEFVHEHDKELESRPLMDYGLEVDPLQYSEMHPLGPAHSRHSFSSMSHENSLRDLESAAIRRVTPTDDPVKTVWKMCASQQDLELILSK